MVDVPSLSWWRRDPSFTFLDVPHPANMLQQMPSRSFRTGREAIFEGAIFVSADQTPGGCGFMAVVANAMPNSPRY
jgi:hypothetical protein